MRHPESERVGPLSSGRVVVPPVHSPAVRGLARSAGKPQESSVKTQSSSTGIGLGTILFLIFLVLKLTHYIDWSWWWVTAPLWIGFALVVGLFAVILAFAGIATLLER
jgi:hypothetical protein